MADSLERNLCPDDGTSPLVNVQPVQNSFVLYHVSTDECITIISNLKSTSCGSDHPSSNTLKRIKEIVAEPLSFLINKSFDCGIFPSKFKEATITPLFKSGDPRKLSNYRPISVLPLVKRRLHFQTCLANKFVTQVWEGCLTFTLYRLNQFSANRKLAKEGCVTMDSERPVALT